MHYPIVMTLHSTQNTVHVDTDEVLSQPKSAPSGWQQYFDALVERGIPIKARRWYTIRARMFSAAFRAKRLSNVTAADTQTFLADLSTNKSLNDWQFEQTVHAIEILLTDIIGLPWTEQFDWLYWKQAAKTLTPDHPTLAREPVREIRNNTATSVNNQQNNHNKHVEEHFAVPLKRLVDVIRSRQYSIRTEQTYRYWVVRFLSHHLGRSIDELGANDVEAFLSQLVVERAVAPNTQQLALTAVVFFFRRVLDKSLDDMTFTRAKQARRLPVVLGRAEVQQLLAAMEGRYGLMAGLLYGTGMRLMECIRLRVKDIDFA